jgi:hypothetical protein
MIRRRSSVRRARQVRLAAADPPERTGQGRAVKQRVELVAPRLEAREQQAPQREVAVERVGQLGPTRAVKVDRRVLRLAEGERLASGEPKSTAEVQVAAPTAAPEREAALGQTDRFAMPREMRLPA